MKKMKIENGARMILGPRGLEVVNPPKVEPAPRVVNEERLRRESNPIGGRL